MPKAARLGDPIGHTPPGGGPQGGGGGDVTGKIIGPCSGNVFTNGIKAARAHVDKTVCSKHDKAPPPPIATGSATVFINGFPAARVNDKIACGAFIIDGSSNVFIGDSGAQTDTVMPEGVMAPGLESVLQMAEIGATAAYGSPAAATAELLQASRISANPPPLKGEDSYITGSAYNVRGEFDRVRRPAVIGKPTERKIVFRAGKPAEPALVYPVTVDGHTVQVYVHKKPPTQADGVTVPGVEAIAKSLGTLQGQQLILTEKILISPYPSPEDTPTVGDTQGTRRAAEAGNRGIVYFPLPDQLLSNQDSMDSLMMHESAHHIHRQRWRDFPEEQVEWENARRYDGNKPSLYSEKTPQEDFAESVIMYRISKGTPEEARARDLFPARYQILDEVLSVEGAQ